MVVLNHHEFIRIKVVVAMPKRTNDFQKLVLAINNHFASESAKVTESAMLFDPESEQYREIDILIEDEIGGYYLKVGVECTAIGRPLTVGKLAELVDKHKNVGINKTVIVSRSGFAGSTEKKAEKLGVELIAYEAAMEKDWPLEFKVMSNIKPVHISCELIRDLPLTLTKESSLDGFTNGEDYTVVEHRKPVSQFLFELLNSKTGGLMLPPYLSAEHAENEGVSFTENWSFDPPITLRSKNGKTAKIIGASPSYLYRRTTLVGDLKAGVYNNRMVASSVLKSNRVFKESRFTISSDTNQNGQSGFSLSLSLDTL